MTDLLPDTDAATDVRPDRKRPDRRSTARTPRWVYVFAIIAIVVVLLLVVQILMGGNHGPGRHKMSGDAGGHTLSASVAEGHTPAEMYVSSVAPSRMEPLMTTRDRGDVQ